MNGEVVLRSCEDITYKWELAHILSKEPTIPKEISTTLFAAVIDEFERKAQIKFRSDIRDKIWSSVSKKPLEKLTETYYLEFCKHVLGEFKEEEIKEILDQNKRNCVHVVYINRLSMAHASQIQIVKEAVIQKSCTIIPDTWFSEINALALKEI